MIVLFSSSSELETTPINVAIHASQVFPVEAEFYQQRQSGGGGAPNPAEYRIQYSEDFGNIQGRNQEEQEELFVVDVEGIENTSGDDIEDYIESVYNDNYLERSSDSTNYNENYDDENQFGEEWDIMMEGYAGDVDTSQDYPDQYLAASTSHPVTLQMEERDDGRFGQEWDIMEEYVDEEVAPSHIQGLLDYNLAQTQPDLTGPRVSQFGQQWDLMEDYDHYPDPLYQPEVQEIELGAELQVADSFGQEMIEVEQEFPYREDVSSESERVSSEAGLVNQGDSNHQMEDYQYYDHNQHLAFSTGIQGDQQEENPYYNNSPVMVHEHLAEDYADYSDFIPNMSPEDETKKTGLFNEGNRNFNDDLSEESESLTELESNHISTDHQEEEEDQMSRNAKVTILSELAEDETTTTSQTELPSISTTLQPTLVSSSSPDTTVITVTTVTTDITTDTTEAQTVPIETTTEAMIVSEETTTIPDTTTLSSQTERDSSLPYNIEALNLVSMDRLNSEREDSMVTPLLPFPEPLSEERPTVEREELYSLPAGHGLRFRFKIDQLNQYIPSFGFATE